MTAHAAAAPSRVPFFTCASCGTGLYEEPQGRTALAFERWFASHGWSVTTGRPFCPCCRPVVYGTFRVPVRPGDDAALADGLDFTDVRADELTLAEFMALPTDARHEAEADLAHMEMVAARTDDPTPADEMAEAVADDAELLLAMLIGADDPAAWRDHEHGGEREPMAAE